MKHIMEMNELMVVDEEDRSGEDPKSKTDVVFARANMPPPFIVVIHETLFFKSNRTLDVRSTLITRFRHTALSKGNPNLIWVG
jgi:hypothetical protein